MRRQVCRVDSLCDHSMPEELILFVGRLLRARSREASEEAKFACTRTPVSSCSDCRTRPLVFVEVRVPGEPMSAGAIVRRNIPALQSVDGSPSWRRRSG
jgi:hypothetical protein